MEFSTKRLTPPPLVEKKIKNENWSTRPETNSAWYGSSCQIPGLLHQEHLCRLLEQRHSLNINKKTMHVLSWNNDQETLHYWHQWQSTRVLPTTDSSTGRPTKSGINPPEIMKNPRTRFTFNKLVKSKIIDNWGNSLHSEAATKVSLIYFKPYFMSLTTPHRMFGSFGTNPFETNKNICQAALISGRFKTDYLMRHWVKEIQKESAYCALNWNFMPQLITFMLSRPNVTQLNSTQKQLRWVRHSSHLEPTTTTPP